MRRATILWAIASACSSPSSSSTADTKSSQSDALAPATAKLDRSNDDSRTGLVKRCQKADGAACLEAAHLYLVQPGPEKQRGIELLELGCRANEGAACFELATAYHFGSLVAKDEARALELVKRGCELKDPRSCVQLGKEVMKAGGPNHVAEARALFTVGCERNDGASCFGVGVTYDRARDFGTSRRYFRRACELGSRESCEMLRLDASRAPARASNGQAEEREALMACFNKCFAKKDPELSVRELQKRCQDKCKFPDHLRF